MDTVLKRWGMAWILTGILVFVGNYVVSSRDGLLHLTLGYLGFSVCAVLYASKDTRRALGQLVLGFSLVAIATGIFVSQSIPPMSAIPMWLGLISGGANFLVGQKLSLLALLGQITPIALVTFTNVTRHDLNPRLAVVCFLLASFCCLLGSILARLFAKSRQAEVRISRL